MTARRTISPEVRRLFEETSAAPTRAEGAFIIERFDMNNVPAADREWVSETVQDILHNKPE